MTIERTSWYFRRFSKTSAKTSSKLIPGEEAIRQMQNAEFAVVLLDVQMPGMDGFATAK